MFLYLVIFALSFNMDDSKSELQALVARLKEEADLLELSSDEAKKYLQDGLRDARAQSRELGLATSELELKKNVQLQELQLKARELELSEARHARELELRAEEVRLQQLRLEQDKTLKEKSLLQKKNRPTSFRA